LEVELRNLFRLVDEPPLPRRKIDALQDDERCIVNKTVRASYGGGGKCFPPLNPLCHATGPILQPLV